MTCISCILTSPRSVERKNKVLDIDNNDYTRSYFILSKNEANFENDFENDFENGRLFDLDLTALGDNASK